MIYKNQELLKMKKSVKLGFTNFFNYSNLKIIAEAESDGFTHFYNNLLTV